MGVINVPGVRDYATKGATDEIQSGITSVKADTATNNTASKTGTLSQKESYTIGLLENGAYGLNALNTALSSKVLNSGFKTPSIPVMMLNVSLGNVSHSHVAHIDGNIYVFYNNKCGKYNISTKTFTQLPNLTFVVGNNPTAVIGSNVYFFGVRVNDSYLTYRYNVITNVMTSLSAAPAMFMNSTVVEYNNQVYIFGGKDIDGSSLNAAYKYNPSTDKYTKLNDTPIDFYARNCVCVQLNGIIYLLGPTNQISNDLNVYKYNIAQDTYTEHMLYYVDALDYIDDAVVMGNNIFNFGKSVSIYNVKSEKVAIINCPIINERLDYYSWLAINSEIYGVDGDAMYKISPIKLFPNLYLKSGTKFYTDADVYNSSYALISGNTIPADGVYYFVGPDPYISIY